MSRRVGAGDLARPAVAAAAALACGHVDLRTAVRRATDELTRAGVASAAVDAVLLAAHALGVDAGEVRRRIAVGGSAAPDRYADLVGARACRVPLQHLTGAAPFRGLPLSVGPGVFVPRPETEVLVDHALRALDAAALTAGSGGLLVDLATGSGAIALAVKAERPAVTVRAAERSRRALLWAERNRRQLGLDVHLEEGDARSAFDSLRGDVDVVTSNPPYLVPGAEALDPEVADHDPDLALYGGGLDGLDLPLAFAARAAVLLRPGGRLVLEHGPAQGDRLRATLDGTGQWSEVTDHPDLAGRPRVLVAVRARAAEPGAYPGAHDGGVRLHDGARTC